MCFADYDACAPSVFDESTPTARKEHRCSECGGVIAKGVKYKRVFGVWDGCADSFKICPACDELRERIVEHELAEGCDEDESHCPFGQLGQYLADHQHPDMVALRPATTSQLREVFMRLPLPERHEEATV